MVSRRRNAPTAATRRDTMLGNEADRRRGGGGGGGVGDWIRFLILALGTYMVYSGLQSTRQESALIVNALARLEKSAANQEEKESLSRIREDSAAFRKAVEGDFIKLTAELVGAQESLKTSVEEGFRAIMKALQDSGGKGELVLARLATSEAVMNESLTAFGKTLKGHAEELGKLSALVNGLQQEASKQASGAPSAPERAASTALPSTEEASTTVQGTADAAAKDGATLSASSAQPTAPHSPGEVPSSSSPDAELGLRQAPPAEEAQRDDPPTAKEADHSAGGQGAAGPPAESAAAT